MIREKTGRQDDGAGDVNGRCGRLFHGADVVIEGDPPGGGIGASVEAQAHEKKKG